jgi:hypothetical protein
MSRCDAHRDHLRSMNGNEVATGSTRPEPGSRPVRATRTTDDLVGEAIWVCPAVVSLTAAEIAAALYAFSDLIEEIAEPSCAVVREELSFVIARYGAAMIERAAESIAGSPESLLFDPLAAIDGQLDGAPSAVRLDWCRRQADLVLGVDDQ